ncbi:hypothetical protein [Thalassiella azotivora]
MTVGTAVARDSDRTAPGSGDADGAGWHEAWSRALHGMELDVVQAEALLTAVHAGADLPSPDEVSRRRWSPPTGLGPLPIALQDRAAALLARQQEVGRRLAEAAHTNRQHQRAAVAHREAPPAVPVYVDVAL